MKVALAADHGGFELKTQIAVRLARAGHHPIDFGNTAYDPRDDYPDFVVPVARAVVAGHLDRGILIGGTGVGASVAANKIAGARAALIHDPYSARRGVEDDDMNVLCLGARTTGASLAWACVVEFLDARFNPAARNRRRQAKLAQLEIAVAPTRM